MDLSMAKRMLRVVPVGEKQRLCTIFTLDNTIKNVD